MNLCALQHWVKERTSVRQVSHHGPPPTSTAQVEERASISGAALRSPPLPRSHTRMRTCMAMHTGYRV